jgi:hypothetical protein
MPQQTSFSLIAIESHDAIRVALCNESGRAALLSLLVAEYHCTAIRTCVLRCFLCVYV